MAHLTLVLVLLALVPEFRTHFGWKCDACKVGPIRGDLYARSTKEAYCSECAGTLGKEDSKGLVLCRNEEISLGIVFRELDKSASGSGQITYKHFRKYVASMGAPTSITKTFFSGVENVSKACLDLDAFRVLFVGERSEEKCRKAIPRAGDSSGSTKVAAGGGS